MISINKVTILGNITRDPELKSTPSGSKVATFGVATNRSYKAADGSRKDEVEFHNVVVWGKQAENTAMYMKKGSQILIEGKIKTRSYDKDSATVYRTEIIADNVQFGSAPANTTTGRSEETNIGMTRPAAATTSAIEYPEEEINLEDIPF